MFCIRSHAPPWRALGSIACVALVMALSAVQVQPAFGESSPAHLEESLVRTINADRSRAGLPGLRVDRRLSAEARRHTMRMIAADELFHANDLVERAGITNWRRTGENVGYAASLDEVQAAMIESDPHRANLRGSFDTVGVGAVRDDSGLVWITEVFVRSAPKKK